jgi:hypothetical protein
MPTHHFFARLAIALLGLLLNVSAFAATVTVSSVSDLQTAINAAAPGDTIVVRNGVYTTSGSLTVNRVGTASAPIMIVAESVGGVTINGSGGFRFSSPAAYVQVDGFVFNHAGSINIPSGTNHIRISRSIIELSIPTGSDVSYINISGDDVEIDHNELRNKSTLGEMLDIAGSGSQVARRLWVHHNYFHDFKSPGGNGAETIRWGLSGLSLSNGEGMCEFNLFVRCNGENELISNKSGGNTYRYNTFIDSPGAQLTLRHGNECVTYGNYFRNTAGLRVYGDRHQIFSNYFEANSIGVDMGNGDGNVEDGADLTSHDRPEDCVVVFNTFVNNSTHYQMGGRTGGLGALNITFADNIIQGGTKAVSISSSAPYTGSWSGNLIWNVPTIGNIPAEGYTSVDPKLAADSNGVFHIQSGSPAIGSAVGDYPFVTVDQDGQVRDSFKDKGADEFSSGQIVARLLTPADVGPGGTGGGGSGGGTSVPNITFEAETLAFTSTGASSSISFEDTASGGQFPSPHITNPDDPLYPQRHRYVTLNADGNPAAPNGEYIEFTLPNIPRGTYNLQLRYKTHPTNRGIARVFVDNVQLGSDFNQLASATFTNRDLGVVRFAETGNHVVRLAVVGKTNLAAAPTSPWNLTADLFTLVPDSTKPVFTSFPTDITTEATGPAGAIATYTGTATDNKDGVVPVVFTPASGTTFPLGDSLVVGSAQDFAGNIAVASFEVSVVDTRPPVFPALPDVTAEATSSSGAAVTLAATAHDIVNGDIGATFTPASGSTFALGTTPVIATAADASGNSGTAGFNVIVRDTTPPTLALPANLTVEATSAAGTTVTFAASASDLVSGNVAVNLSPASGSTFALGTTTVAASAQDAAGNVSTGSFTVTVRDTTAPAIVALHASPDVLGAPNHTLVPVAISATVQDAADAAPHTRIIGVTSNEPINGPGDGNTAPDYQITGDLTLTLRAERAGNGADRVYTILVESRDAAGNVSTGSITVTVPHDSGR